MTTVDLQDDKVERIAEVRRTLDIFQRPRDVVEIRILGIPGRGRPHTAAGYFDDFQAAAESVVEYDDHSNAAGIYFVMNQVNPALLARSPNRITRYPDNTTTDNDIVQRRFLLVDVDPSRPAGIGSTDAELQTARKVAESVREWLASRYWSQPIEAMSGNGCHLLYPVSLPNDVDSKTLIETVLKVLDSQFSTEAVSIDKAVFNAARITKLYGTSVRKGHSTADRPHRRSRLLYVPDYLQPDAHRDIDNDAVPVERLQAVAALWQPPTPKQSAAGTRVLTKGGVPLFPNNNGSSRLLVDSWLRDRGVAFTTKTFSDGRQGYLITCPFDESHNKGETFIAQEASGKLSAQCKHNSCAGRGWQEFKVAIGEPEGHHYDPPRQPREQKPKQQTPAQQPEETTDQQPTKRIEFTRISSAELDTTDFELTYLVDDILVDQQPCLIAGPHKSLKTNMLVDLAISLAIGGRFLGVFKVREPVRVGVMSGESGLATLQETGRRIARAAGTWLAEIDNLIWTPDLPVFGHPDYMEALEQFITADSLRVVVIDPAYLATPLAADKGNNLFAIGELLRSVNDVCQQCGCTLLIAHHMKKSNLGYDPPELADAAWSGWAEWARQWLLINRRERYDPDSDGEHRLWFSVGGSAGHSGLWGLDITEGRRNAPEGRYWDVVVRPASDVRAEAKDDRQVEKEREAAAKFEKDLDAVAEALDAHPKGATRTRLREHCGMSGTRFGKAIAELLRRNIAERCDVKVSNHKQLQEGYRRAPDTP